MIGLNKYSLISVVKLNNAGYEVKMSNIIFKVRYEGKTVVTCGNYTRIGLWLMIFTQMNNINTENDMVLENQEIVTLPVAYSTRQTGYQTDLVHYHHQSLFSPPSSTILKVLVGNNQLTYSLGS